MGAQTEWQRGSSFQRDDLERRGLFEVDGRRATGAALVRDHFGNRGEVVAHLLLKFLVFGLSDTVDDFRIHSVRPSVLMSILLSLARTNEAIRTRRKESF